MLTPEEIEGRRFASASEGYDRAQVDAFLAEVATTVRAARARLKAHDGGDAFAVLGQEVADILRATELAAARKRSELEAELGARRAEFDIALEETRQQAEREHEQAKRLLVRAQQRADDIVAEAEERARARVRRADAEARERSEIVLERARRREARLVEAERAAAQRVQALRAQLAAVLDGIALGDDPEPVLDLTDGEAVLRSGDEDDRRDPGRGIVGVVTDPVDHVVQAAVARAQDHAIRAETPVTDDRTRPDEPDTPLRPDVDSGGHPANGTGRG